MVSQRKRILFASPWWHSELVNGIVTHAAKKGWRMDLRPCFSGDLPETWNGDGYATMLGGIEDQRRFIANATCPGVSLNENFPDVDIPIVTGDKTAAGRLAAEHLMDRGFRSYAFYASEFSPAGRPRFVAFADRLAEAGHSVQVLSAVDEQIEEADRPAWLRQRLAEIDKPVGLFAFNDRNAIEVIDTCLDELLDVPDQVAVLGLLDMDVFRHCTSIGLSSIAFDSDEIARVACDLLERMMDGEPPPAEPILLPPTGVRVRQSTDTLAAHKPIVARAVRYMFDHYQEPIDIDHVVQHVGGSRGGLFKAFRNDMGCTPGRALMRIRIDKAKRMLVESDEKAYAVADACGFGKPVNLHRAFQKLVGDSPIAYRKRRRRAGPAHTYLP